MERWVWQTVATTGDRGIPGVDLMGTVRADGDVESILSDLAAGVRLSSYREQVRGPKRPQPKRERSS